MLLTLSLLTLSGCIKPPLSDPISVTSFKLDTFVTITIYDSQDESLLSECLSICDRYEKMFDRTNPESDLSILNNTVADEQTLVASVDPELAQLIQKGLSYTLLTNGAFHIAMEPVTSLWDFHSEAPVLPDKKAVEASLSLVNASNLSVDENEVIRQKPYPRIDLGGIAKGYIADQLKAYLLENGVKSATINLGGNVLCIGSKPDGELFRIGIRKPFASPDQSAAAIMVSDCSVVTSGVYERYFEQNGKQYHHILDSTTGYPADTDLLSVTILSKSSADADALSTACLVSGLQKGTKLIESLRDVDAIFITKDYKLHYTSGFQQKYKVTEAP